ncbi:MAG: SLBB domain-containing protein [Planctomycetes bacterium]|nr:SLBB domain-containing protein [Planctomycetota bacterium]
MNILLNVPAAKPPYLAARKALELGPDKVIDQLKLSGLSGRGGAGFPAGVKWDTVKNASASPKYLIINAEESEPGTFKDRQLLTENPHAVIEGALIGALTTGCTQGYIYIRPDYRAPAKAFAKALEEARKDGLLGKNAAGSGKHFDIEVCHGGGAYICGEETALINSLEGKRGEPNTKPPFPANEGFKGKPTLLSNVETFAYVPWILLNGAETYALLGVNGCKGMRLFSVSGDVAKPGNYELPVGVTARELIFKHAGGMRDGKKLKAFIPGGASSSPLPPELLDTPMDFKPLAAAGSMLGSGAVVAISDEHSMLDVARNVMGFFEDESCGKCSPCRIGCVKINEMLDEPATLGAKQPLLNELADGVMQGSLCGLGMAAPNVVKGGLKYWARDFAGK